MLVSTVEYVDTMFHECVTQWTEPTQVHCFPDLLLLASDYETTELLWEFFNIIRMVHDVHSNTSQIELSSSEERFKLSHVCFGQCSIASVGITSALLRPRPRKQCYGSDRVPTRLRSSYVLWHSLRLSGGNFPLPVTRKRLVRIRYFIETTHWREEHLIRLAAWCQNACNMELSWWTLSAVGCVRVSYE